jgi:hypothetical protein
MPAKDPCGDTKHEPEAGKGDTDLSEEIEGHIRVIPYVPVHNNIVEDTDGKLGGGYDKSTCDTAAHKSHLAAAVKGVKRRKHRSAGERHGPVSITAHGYLDKTVTEISHKKRI